MKITKDFVEECFRDYPRICFAFVSHPRGPLLTISPSYVTIIPFSPITVLSHFHFDDRFLLQRLKAHHTKLECKHKSFIHLENILSLKILILMPILMVVLMLILMLIIKSPPPPSSASQPTPPSLPIGSAPARCQISIVNKLLLDLEM